MILLVLMVLDSSGSSGSITNAIWLVSSCEVHCETCCGGTKKRDAMFFILIPTIKYYRI